MPQTKIVHRPAFAEASPRMVRHPGMHRVSGHGRRRDGGGEPIAMVNSGARGVQDARELLEHTAHPGWTTTGALTAARTASSLAPCPP